MRAITVRLLLLGTAVFTLAFGAAAQGAPEPIQDALAALNQRLGTQMTLNDLFWTWEQQTFPDSSLGCVQEGITPVPTSVIGYKFTFTYLDISYEYRVSADRTLTVFCGVLGETDDPVDPNVAGLIDDPARLSNSQCPPPPAGLLYPRTRLAPATEARVIPGAPNNLRTEPNPASGLIGQIPGGATLRVLAGPICDAQGMIWIQAEFSGQIGYTAEAFGGEYYLEPQPPLAELPVNRARISGANLATVREAAKLQGNFGSGVAWSQTNKLAITGDAGANGLLVFSPTTVMQSPRMIKSLERFVIARFSTVSTQGDTLLLGSDDGSVHIWDLSPSSNLIERLVLNGHNAAVTAVAISPDGRRVASSGGYAFATTENALNQDAILVWDINNVTQAFALRGHTGTVTAVAFSPDGLTIASSSLDGSVRLWDTANGAQTARIDAGVPATSLAYSPDGATLAVGYQDGATLALSLVGGLSAGPVVPTHSAPVTVIAFSPNGSVLLSGATDGSLALRAGDRLLTPEPPTLLLNVHSAGVTGVGFSPDGSIIVSLGQDNTARLLIAGQ